MTSDVYSLLLPFDRDSAEFTLGVEIGRLWELTRGDGEVRETIHAENVEMALRISEARSRPVRCEELTDEWLEVIYPGPEVGPHDV